MDTKEEIEYDEGTGLPILREKMLFWKITSGRDWADVRSERVYVGLYRMREARDEELTMGQLFRKLFFRSEFMKEDEIGSNTAPLSSTAHTFWTEEDHEEMVKQGWTVLIEDEKPSYYFRPAKVAISEAATQIYEHYIAKQNKTELDRLKGTYVLQDDKYVRGEFETK